MGPVRYPPAILVAPGLAAGILAHVIGGAPLAEGDGVQATSAILSALGVALLSWPLIRMAQAGTPAEPWHDPTKLVVDGPYQFTRNPIYLSFLLLQAGAPLWWGWWMPLALVPISGWLLTQFVIKREEAYLAAKFPEYDAYRARVRRWL